MSTRLLTSAALVFAIIVFGASLKAAPPAARPQVQLVRPGGSIQAAIDQVESGGSVLVLPGVYRETADVTNGLTITRAVNLIGLSTPGRRVILENAGGQRNGIVVVPADRTSCMSCHSTLAPPFDLLPGVPRGVKMREPMMHGTSISGFTIRNFANNGLFTENLDGFLIDDVESSGNTNYGIFPTLSKNGDIRRCRASGSHDSGVWVETSQNIRVTDTIVEDNVIGFELSNSDDITFAGNESRGNTVGMGLFVLPFLFDDRPGAKRMTVADNFIHDNNRVNDAPPRSLQAGLPSGIGLLHLGVDDSRIADNRIENNASAGIAVVDACIAWAGTRLDCGVNPFVTPAFLADQDATHNRVTGNVLAHNGTNPPPSPFAAGASDLALLSLGAGNCFSGNTFTTSFSLLGVLPPCR
jgi:parallel beta-helix repeat protein